MTGSMARTRRILGRNPIYFVVQSPILVVDAPDELREGGDDW
jgi:hypothetical protein